MKIVQKALRTSLDPEIIRAALIEFAREKGERPKDLEDRTITLLRMLYAMDKISDADRPWIMLAVEWRLSALAKLNDCPKFKAYSIGPDRTGADWISDVVVKVAATEPLIQRDEYTVEFDPDSFYNALLAATEAEGRA